MTTSLPYPTNYNDAVSDRKIYDPERDGLEYNPDVMNWSSKDFSLPTGDKLGIFKVLRTSLYRIGFVEKTANARTIPHPYNGMYTSPEFAQKDLEKFLIESWTDAENRTSRKQREALRAEAAEKEAETE